MISLKTLKSKAEAASDKILQADFNTTQRYNRDRLAFARAANPATVLTLCEALEKAMKALSHIQSGHGIEDCCVRAFHKDDLDNHDVTVADDVLQQLKGVISE